jgi:hypothetical protein
MGSSEVRPGILAWAEVAMPGELPDKVQRWTAKRRAAVVLIILKRETSTLEVARKYGLRVAEVEEWRDRFLIGAENELRSRPRDEVAHRDAQAMRRFSGAGLSPRFFGFSPAPSSRPAASTTGLPP